MVIAVNTDRLTTTLANPVRPDLALRTEPFLAGPEDGLGQVRLAYACCASLASTLAGAWA